MTVADVIVFGSNALCVVDALVAGARVLCSVFFYSCMLEQGRDQERDVSCDDGDDGASVATASAAVVSVVAASAVSAASAAADRHAAASAVDARYPGVGANLPRQQHLQLHH